MDQIHLESALVEHRKWLELSLTERQKSENIRLTLINETLKKIKVDCENISSSEIINTKFIHSTLTNCTFDNSNLTGTRFREVIFTGSSFKKSNLSSCIFIKTDFSAADLSNSNIIGAEINGCIFKKSSLAACDLKRVSGKYSNFTEARLNGANFEASDLSHSSFKNCNALRVSFKNCFLDEADFTGAKLHGTNFSGARMRLVRFESKHQLKDLKVKLTAEQLQSVIFEDETNYKSPEEKKGNLRVHLYADHITPINLSYLFVSINAAYNNLLYLSKTIDGVEKALENIKPFYNATNAEDDLYVHQINKGSIIIDFVTYVGGGAVILKLLGDLIPKISSEIRGYKALPSNNESELKEKLLALDVELKKQLVAEKKKDIEIKERVLTYIDNLDVNVKHTEAIKEMLKIEEHTRGLIFENPQLEEKAEFFIKESTMPLLNVLYKYDEMGYEVTASCKIDSEK